MAKFNFTANFADLHAAVLFLVVASDRLVCIDIFLYDYFFIPFGRIVARYYTFFKELIKNCQISLQIT